MHYEINVSKKNNGRYTHYFATAPRSLENAYHVDMLAMVNHFQGKFPAPEYEVTVTKYETTGTILDV